MQLYLKDGVDPKRAATSLRELSGAARRVIPSVTRREVRALRDAYLSCGYAWDGPSVARKGLLGPGRLLHLLLELSHG